jgi:predicted nucleic acid-binding Zn ribbon protein
MPSEKPESGREAARSVRPQPPFNGRRERPDGDRSRSSRDNEPARRPTLRGSRPLTGALQNAITPMESAPRIRESLALAYWERVAGPQAAAASEAETVRDGVLFVRTKSSVWSHELTLYKSQLLQGINRMLGGQIIHEIVFRAQGLTRASEQIDPDTPSPEEMAAVVLDPAERAELRARLQALIAIPDDHVRQSIAARLTLETKLRHWRLERGWRVCPRCDVIHKTEHRLCPICRLSR